MSIHFQALADREPNLLKNREKKEIEKKKNQCEQLHRSLKNMSSIGMSFLLMGSTMIHLNPRMWVNGATTSSFDIVCDLCFGRALNNTADNLPYHCAQATFSSFAVLG